MSDKDFDTLRAELAAFSRRLKAKIQEFHDRGTFSDTHEAFVTRLLQGHAAIEAKLESAVRSGAGAAATKNEIERDFNALTEDFGHLEERLHAESMKH
jgi:hypothetical protein